MDAAVSLSVGFATRADLHAAVRVLAEAGAYMARNHRMLWNADALGVSFVRPLIARGELVAARVAGELAGVCMLTRQDPEFWPEDSPGEAAYLHKLAVRRAYAGGGVTGAIFAFCRATAQGWGCRALKLDCDPSLGRIYMHAGFEPVDQRTIAPPDRAPFVVDRFAMPLG